MKRLLISCFLFINSLCFAETKIIENQDQIDKISQNLETENLDLICNPPVFNPYDFQALAKLNKLNSLKITYNGAVHSSLIFWDAIFTLPPLEQLEVLALDKTWIHTVIYEKDDIRKLWEFIPKNFPKLKRLELTSISIAGSIMEEPKSENTLEGLAALMPDLEELCLRNCLRDRFYGIEKFEKLRVLDLEYNQLFVYHHQHKEDNFLFKLKNLETLKMGNCKPSCDPYGPCNLNNVIPPDFFERGLLSNLTTLDLTKLVLNTLELKNFAPSLKHLILDQVHLNKSRLESLASLQNLETLSMANVDLQEEHIEQFSFFSLPMLTQLNLAGTKAKKIPFSTFAPNLLLLNVSNSSVSGGDIKEIAMLEKLEHLNLQNTKISGPSLKHLAKLHHLQVLNLKSTNIRNGALEALAALPSLQELDLSETNLSVEDFNKLFSLTQLKTLKLKKLGNGNITTIQIEDLKTALPNCKIEVN